MKFRKIGIIGVGLMGGSLALSLRRRYPHCKIFGYARSKESLERLKKLNIVHRVTTDIKEVVENCDLVVLGLPVKIIEKYLKKINPYLDKKTIVIDLGSTKCNIENSARRYLTYYKNFVGCHPLCGSEKSGPLNAQEGLYDNSLCIITSSPKKNATKIVKKMWEDIGVKVCFMSPKTHDKILSYVSHFPHLLSFSLTFMVPTEFYKFVSGGFKSIGRLAKSNIYLWKDIFLANRENVIKNIEEFTKILYRFKVLLEKGREETIISFLESARKKIKSTS